VAQKQIYVASYATQDQRDDAFWLQHAERPDMDLPLFVGSAYRNDVAGSLNVGQLFLYREDLGPFWERLRSILLDKEKEY